MTPSLMGPDSDNLTAVSILSNWSDSSNKYTGLQPTGELRHNRYLTNRSTMNGYGRPSVDLTPSWRMQVLQVSFIQRAR